MARSSLGVSTTTTTTAETHSLSVALPSLYPASYSAPFHKSREVRALYGTGGIAAHCWQSSARSLGQHYQGVTREGKSVFFILILLLTHDT